MLGIFGKKKKQRGDAVPTPSPVTAAPPAGTTIYAMPSRFFAAPKKRFWTAGKIWLVVLVLVVALVGGTYLLLVTVEQPSANPPSAPATATETTSAEPATPTNLPGTSLPVVESPVAPADDTPTITEPAPVAPSAPEPPLAPTPNPVIPPGPDADGDGLTDVEETTIYGSDPRAADSDADGFPDFVELTNGYSPVGPEVLSDTDLFATYTDAERGLVVPHPAAWTALPTGGSGVQFAASGSEFVVVLLQPNPQEQSIIEWYSAAVPSIPAGTLRLETFGQKRGIFTPDRTSFYFLSPTRPDTVVVVSHNVGESEQRDYAGTVALMVQGIELSE